MRKRAVLLVILAGIGFFPAEGQMRARSWEISPYIGILDGSSRLGNSTEPYYGLRVGYNLNRWWQVELAYGTADGLNVEQQVGTVLKPFQDSTGAVVLGPVPLDGRVESEARMADLNIVLTARPVGRRWFFYGTAGIGYADFTGSMTQEQIDDAFPFGPGTAVTPIAGVDNYTCFTCQRVPAAPDSLLDPNDPSSSFFLATGEETEGVDSTQWNMGGGVRAVLTDSMAIRMELRINNGFEGQYNALALTAGLSFRLGGEPPIDDDGDVIPTFRDRCPDTPVGATVDKKGCPSDSDADAVLDGLDQCPDTPAGWPVDDVGCPTDTDGDGVPDGRDQCAETLAGAVVDEDGCAIDSDLDGVPDGIDQCAATPTGAVVDEVGCPVDSDGDGVPDGLDQCENTPEGIRVDELGCPVDSDGDGLKDDVDACIEFAGPGGIDEEGCPRFRLDQVSRVPLPTVRFATGSSALNDAAQEDLVALVTALLYYDTVTIDIEGHTDDIGSERDNFLVSVDRARSVHRYLVDAGVDESRMTARGFGEIRPIADNTTPEGRAENRRIEILVTGTTDDGTGEGEDDGAGEDSTGDDFGSMNPAATDEPGDSSTP